MNNIQHIMIVHALLIILVILVISNFAIGIFNKVVPPCTDTSEYFQNASKLPDDAVIGLGSIPSHTGFDYVGAASVSTGIPGVIGLTSYPSLQKNGYADLSSGSIEGYVSNMRVAEEDPSDCVISNTASKAIDDILQTGKRHKIKPDSVVPTSSKTDSFSKFEVSMEGILNKNKDKKQMRKSHTSLAHSSQCDGYGY